jgi:hypothetical protein
MPGPKKPSILARRDSNSSNGQLSSNSITSVYMLSITSSRSPVSLGTDFFGMPPACRVRPPSHARTREHDEGVNRLV